MSCPLPLASKVAVAVSGGPDSMALLHLLHSLTKDIVAVTVEHGLRAESLNEAFAVGAWCKKNKIKHHVLEWQGKKPKTAVHEAARAARYELLENFCRAHHILHLATAHHADDNAETILQRIAKASGPAGLCGMAAHSFTPHLHLWRPLLHHPKKDLVAYCHHFNIPYARDASNENPKYARGRLRGAAEVLSGEGLTPDNLNLFAAKQREIIQLLEAEGVKFLAQHARLIPGVRAEISADAFAAQPAVIQRIVMDYILKLVSGRDAPIRYDSLTALCAAMAAQGFRAKTLGHCRIAPKRIQKKDFIIISPER